MIFGVRVDEVRKEKIAVLSVQEKAKHEANATEDGQPETEVQTEEIAA